MERHTVIVLAIALISVLAIGFAAATVSETVETSDGGEGGLDGGLIDLDRLDLSDRPTGELGRIVVVLLTVVSIGIFLHLLGNPSETYEIVSFLLVAAVGLMAFVLLIAALLNGGDIPLFGSGLPGFGDGAGDGARRAIPAFAIITVFAVFLILLVVAFRRADESTKSETGEKSVQETPSTDPETREAVGEIAGQAADRIDELDDRSVENEVYRAWDEMTNRLDARDDASTTPREFARMATDAGLSTDDVDELTTLFEDVRYGGYSPTTDREQRAVAVLRRIEEEYR